MLRFLVHIIIVIIGITILMLTYTPKCNDKKFSRLVNNLLLGKIYHFKEKVRTTQWINRHQNTIILEIKCIIINKVILSGPIWFNVCVCARVHSKKKNDSWAFTKSLTELLFSFLFYFAPLLLRWWDNSKLYGSFESLRELANPNFFFEVLK